MINIPKRGFETIEYESRLENIQRLMFESAMDVILLTTQVDIEYYTGFKTQFFQSPTRPWFVLIPSKGKPRAIIPVIGESGMRETWIDDIKTWMSPNPKDDGISLLTDSIKLFAKNYKCMGVSLGQESTIRMPQSDYEELKNNIPSIEIKDANLILREVRYTKSAAEVDKIRHVCQITSKGFIDLEGMLKVGLSERHNCQLFKQYLLALGVDDSPYLVSGSGRGGYGSIIMGPTDKLIEEGDIFIIDTGSVFDSYYCDFDRNYAFGSATDMAKKAYQTIFKATEKGFTECQVGNTTSDVFNAMNTVMQDGGAIGSTVGRLGHGLGLQLTEWPSNTANDNTILKPGVVLTLEPGMMYLPGKEMVHEENIVITEDGPEWLSIRANEELPIIR